MSEMANRRLNGGIPASALGGTAPQATERTPLARVRIARGELVEFPGYGTVYMRILGTVEMEEIEAATFSRMNDLKLPPTDLHVGTYNLHRFRRILAAAVRDPADGVSPFGTLEEWGQEPDEVLTQGIMLYKDIKARLDPVTVQDLSSDQVADIIEAWKKKDYRELRSFGSAMLASLLLSGAVRQSSSLSPSSKNSDSSQE